MRHAKRLISITKTGEKAEGKNDIEANESKTTKGPQAEPVIIIKYHKKPRLVWKYKENGFVIYD